MAENGAERILLYSDLMIGVFVLHMRIGVNREQCYFVELAGERCTILAGSDEDAVMSGLTIAGEMLYSRMCRYKYHEHKDIFAYPVIGGGA